MAINWADIVSPPQGAPAPGAVPQGGIDVPRGPSLGDILGGTAKHVLEALDAPAAVIQTGLGLGDRQRFLDLINPPTPEGGVGGTPFNQNAQLSDFNPLQVLAGLAGQTGGEVQDLGRAFLETVSNPVNFVGMGVPGKIAAELGPASRLYPILTRLAQGEHLTQQALHAVLTSPVRAGQTLVGRPLPAVPAAVASRVPQAVKDALNAAQEAGQPVGDAIAAIQKLPVTGRTVTREVPAMVGEGATGVMGTRVSTEEAQSLYDLFSSINTKSAFKMAGRSVADAIDNISNTFNPMRAARDIETGSNLLYRMPVNKPLEGQSVLQDLEAKLFARLSDAPNATARAAWLEITRTVEAGAARDWNAAFVAARDAPKATAGVRNQMYKTAVDDIADRYKAAFDMLDDAYAAAKNVKLDPTDETAVNNLFAGSLAQLRAAQKLTPTTGLYPTSWPPGAGDPIANRLNPLVQRMQGIDQIADNFRAAAEPALGEAAGVVDTHASPSRMLSRIGELRNAVSGLPEELDQLPDFHAGPITDVSNKLMKLITAAARGKQLFEDSLEDMWKKYVPRQKYTPFDASVPHGPDDILGHFNQALAKISTSPSFPGSPLPPIQNSADMLEYARRYASGELFKKLDRAAHAFPGADLLVGDPYAAAGDRAIRGMAALYGIDNEKTLKGSLLDFYQNSNAFFKDQALATFSYPLVNASGALFNSTLAGSSPERLARNMLRAMGQELRGKYTEPEEMATFQTAMGQRWGGAAKGESALTLELGAQEARKYTKTAQPIAEKIRRPALAGLGFLAGASGADAQAPQDAAPGERAKNAAISGLAGAIGLGVVYPSMSQLVRRLSFGIEDVARKDVALMASLDKHQAQVPEYQKLISDAFSGSRQRFFPTTLDPATGQYVTNPATGPANFALRPNPGALERVTSIMDQLHWQAPPDVVRSLLLKEGVTPEVATDTMKAWRNLNSNVMRSGEELAGEVHFDYQKLNNLEAFAKEVLPFSTWAMKALPFFAKHLAEKPLILTTVLEMSQRSETERNEGGLPARFANAAHIPFGDALWSAILGHPVMTYFNPLRGLAPFSDAIRNVAQTERPDQTPESQVLNLLQLLGLPQPAPAIQTALRVTGRLDDAPPQGLLRYGGPIQGITSMLGVNRGKGVDLNAGIEGAERAVRRATGGDPADSAELGTMNRIDELFLRQYKRPISTGGPETVPYIQAKANMSGPLWDQAAAEVAKERGTRSLAGAVYGPGVPQALLTPEEEAIRYTRTQRLISPKLSRDINDVAGTSPTARADPSQVAAVLQAASHVKLPERITRLTERPDSLTNAELQQVLKGITAVEAKANPLAFGYGQSGTPDEARLKTLLSLYNAQGELVGGGAGKRLQEELANPNRNPNNPFATAGQSNPRPGLTNPVGLLLAKVKALQDQMKIEQPILAEYLAWKQKNPTGDVEDFMQQRKLHPVAVPGATP
jgi:hypothetical protein